MASSRLVFLFSCLLFFPNLYCMKKYNFFSTIKKRLSLASRQKNDKDDSTSLISSSFPQVKIKSNLFGKRFDHQLMICDLEKDGDLREYGTSFKLYILDMMRYINSQKKTFGFLQKMFLDTFSKDGQTIVLLAGKACLLRKDRESGLLSLTFLLRQMLATIGFYFFPVKEYKEKVTNTSVQRLLKDLNKQKNVELCFYDIAVGVEDAYKNSLFDYIKVTYKSDVKKNKLTDRTKALYYELCCVMGLRDNPLNIDLPKKSFEKMEKDRIFGGLSKRQKFLRLSYDKENKKNKK